MSDNDDLFEMMSLSPSGTADDSDDLFGGKAPSAKETNAAVFSNMIDEDKFKQTSAIVDEKIDELKKQSAEDKKTLMGAIAEMSKDDEGNVVFQWYNPASWIGSGVAKYKKTVDDQIDFLEQNRNMLSNLVTPEQMEDFKNKGAIGVFESAKRNIKWGNAPFAGGFVEGYQKGKISGIMEKVKNGEELSDGENESVREYLMDGIETAVRGSSIGGRIVDGLSQMPAFMIEYGVAKGLVGTVSKKAATTAFGKAASSVAGKVAAKGAVGKAAVKTAKVTGSAAGRALFMPGQVYNNYNDIRVNSAFSLGENGQILFNENQDKPATMVLKAFGLSTITALTEESGEAITGLMRKGVSPIYNRLPSKVRNGIVELARKTEKYKNTPISKMFEAGGYSNVLGEIGEERLEGLLGAVTGLNPQGDNYFDSVGNALMPGWDQFLVEAGVISIAGGARSGLNYLYAKGFSPAILKGLSTTEQDEVINRELKKEAGNTEANFRYEDLPVDKILLSPDIPNFKEGANENGVVVGEELSGPYDRLGTAPIVVWERENGRLEVITGRHRLDLAKRTGETTIPAHVVKEADGFNADQARTLDIEQNIKDEKGTMRDYARYFKAKKMTEKEAKERGLFQRKGEHAFNITNKAGEGLCSLFIDGKISDAKAEAIANGAPNNEAAQAAGIKAAEKMTADELQSYVSILSQTKPTQSESGDLFGFDNSAIEEAEKIAKLVAKDKKDINAKISAVRGAVNNPDLAKKMGIRFKITPEAIGNEIKKLLFQRQKLDNFFTDNKLMAHYRELLAGKAESVFDVLPDEVPADFKPEKEVSSENKDSASTKEKTDDKEEKEVEINNEEGMLERAYRKWVDDVAPFQKLAEDERVDLKPGQRPDLLARAYQYSARMIERNIESETFYIDENGNEVITGEGLAPILKDFYATVNNIEPNSEVASEDLNDFLVASRYLQDLDEMEDVEVTKEQKEQSAADVLRLQSKYGNDFELFADFSRRIYDFQKRILENFVRSGNMSQEQYNEITSKHTHYVPFKRVFEEKELSGVGSKGVFDEAKASRVIKRIVGSDRAVKDVFVSIANNAAKTLDLAYRNRIANSIASLQDFFPEYIKPRKPLFEHGTSTVKVAYDQHFRQQLEKAIGMFQSSFGGDLKYEKSLKAAKGAGLIMGLYNPAENSIRKRLGSQDRTLAHEFGHMIDYCLNVKDAIAGNAKIMSEIKKLAEDRFYSNFAFKSEKGKIVFDEKKITPDADHLAYIKSDREAIANAFDLYFSSRDYMKKAAPETYRFIDNVFSKKELAFLKEIHPSPSSITEDVTNDVYLPSRAKPFGNVIEHYVDGKRKFTEVSLPLYEAMHKLNPMQIGFVSGFLKLFTAPAKLLRYGATMTPNFIIRNFIKDQFTAMIQTDSGMKTTPIHTIKALCEITGNGKIYEEWQRSGGAGGGFYDWSEKGAKSYIDELKNPKGRFMKSLKVMEDNGWTDWKRYANIAGGTVKAPFAAWNKVIGDPSQAVEEATRLGAFAQAKKAGLSDIEAGIKSREATVDFGRGGEYSRIINRLVPFFNVGIQSADKLIRTAKSHPKAFFINSMATIAFPSIAITGYYLYGAPDEDRKKWLEVPQYVRDNNWVFFLPGMDEPITFPKPFTVGYMGTAFEDFMIWLYKGEKPEARGIWDVLSGIMGSMAPVQTTGSLLSPLGQVSIEAMTNYNFFMGKPIYPQWMENLPPEERANKTTSKLGTAIGQKFGVSPAVVDNTIFGLTSTLGRQTVGAAETMIDQFKKWNGEEVNEGITVKKDIPIVGALVGRIPDGSRSRSYQQFADDFKKAQQAHNAYNNKDGAERKEYREKHAFELESYDRLKNFSKQIKTVRKKINEIYENASLSSQRKTEAIVPLERRITEISREANKVTAEIKKKLK